MFQLRVRFSPRLLIRVSCLGLPAAKLVSTPRNLAVFLAWFLQGNDFSMSPLVR
jgi:hypothetical protein